MIGWSLQRILGLALLLLSVATEPATADTASDHKIVSNVAIYLGLIPAEMIRGHPPRATESTMHGGSPAGQGQYHVTIALFDATTGKRITGADVRARVAEIGLSGEEKKLEPMDIAGTETYGNYFPMVGSGPFRINVTVRITGQRGEIKAAFEHRHR